MKFFYRIKCPKKTEYRNEWEYKPFDIGYIEAENKKEARALLEDEYGEKMTMRCKKDDIGTKHFFFVALYEPNDYFDSFYNDKRECKVCKKEFTKLQKDLLHDFMYSGSMEFCSSECDSKFKQANAVEFTENGHGGNGVIYKITNKQTKMSYIGQTTQPFTLRWWQHFTTNSTEKFGGAIGESKLSDWTFEVLEEYNISNSKLLKEKLNEREHELIKQYNSKEKGYNTIFKEDIKEENVNRFEI